MTPNNSPIVGHLIAVVAGLVTPLAFAPFGLFPLGVLAPALLFVCWIDVTPARAMLRGFLFGLGMFGFGVSWVYVSLHNFGNMPPVLASVAVAGFTVLLAGIPALAGLLQGLLCRDQVVVQSVLVIPAVWVLMEWVRSWLLTGFPWMSLGYSQVGYPLGAAAPWIGVYGVGLAVAVSAGAVALLLRSPRRYGAPCALILIGLWALFGSAGRVDWVEPEGKELSVALIQGNVPLEDKWDQARRPEILSRYVEMSAPYVDADLIVWPESAAPYYVDELSEGFWDTLNRHPADYILGVLERVSIDSNLVYYNSVVATTDRERFYRKHHLVPFGEYLPWKPLFGWIIAYLDIPMADFSPWDNEQTRLMAAGQPIGITICYEDAFTDEVLRSLPDATMLVNVSEDGWFGDSLAPHQRLQIARMRALETGRPMLRAANTGISAVIDHRGQVVVASAQFETMVLEGDVRPMVGTTPFARFGNVPVLVISICLVVIGWMRGRAQSS
ncbi:MAG: apolipoprotein N-acyltransferase [Gammaproteobacteria bacterium]|nr:apolipoprotein N-acyltransferase [Gammaproteobacteria bacterium]